MVSRAAREYVKNNRTSLPRPRSMPLQAQDQFAGPVGLGGHFEGDAAGYPEHQKALVSLPIQLSHTDFLYRPMPLRPIRERWSSTASIGSETWDITLSLFPRRYSTRDRFTILRSSANLPRHNRSISRWTCSGVLSAMRSTKLANLDPVRSLGLAADY